MDRPREPLPTRVEDTPPLPPAYDAALDAGLADLGVTLPPGARQAIDGHARLLLAWTTAINLTAIRDPAEVATAHVVDSLSALAVLRDRGVDRFIDLGSGGGYPGPAAGGRTAGGAGAAARAGRQEGSLPVGGDRGGRARGDGRGRAGPGRGARHGSSPPRLVAGGDRPRRRRPRRSRRAGLPAPRARRRAGRLEARRHRAASWPPPGGRSMRSAAARSRFATCPVAGLARPPPGRRDRARPRAGGVSARPRRAPTPAMVMSAHC